MLNVYYFKPQKLIIFNFFYFDVWGCVQFDQVTMSPDLRHKERHNGLSLWNNERWHLTLYVEHHPMFSNIVGQKLKPLSHHHLYFQLKTISLTDGNSRGPRIGSSLHSGPVKNTKVASWE